MRLIGVVLLAFIIAGLTLLLSQNHSRIAAVVLPGEGDGRLVRHFNALPEHLSEIDEAVTKPLKIYRNGENDWLSLSGFPAYARATFPVPGDLVAIKGELVLDITTELVDSAEGVVRFSINGDRRGEFVLDVGEKRVQLKVQLSAVELAANELTVTFSSNGETTVQSCDTRRVYGAVVEVEPTSHLNLYYAVEFAERRDELAKLMRGGNIVWNQQDEGFDPSATLQQALGHGAELALDKRELFLEEEDLASVTEGGRWAVRVSELGVNTAVRRFEKHTQWNVVYDNRDLPNGEAPTQLDLGIVVSELRPGDTWLVAATQNDQLVFHERVPADGTTINRTIYLPEDGQETENDIRITLDADSITPVPCVGVPVAVAQLMPETLLRGGRTLPETDLDLLASKLAQQQAVSVYVPEGLSAPEAQVTLEILQALGTDPEVISWSSEKVLTGGAVQFSTASDPGLRDAIGEFKESDVWVAWFTGSRDDEQERLRIEHIADFAGETPQDLNPSKVFAVISLPSDP